MRLCLLPLLLGSAAALAAEPRPYTAQYRAEALGQSVGQAERKLSRDGRIWRLQLDSSASLLLFASRRTETSELRRAGGGWQPLSYRYRDESMGKTKSGAQTFDWPGRTISGDKDGRPWSLALAGAAFDMASYQLQLAEDLAAGKDVLEYTVVHRGRLKHYRFARRGEESLDTPAGRLKTVRVEQLAEGKGEDATIIWFAPALDYVPARLERRNGGDTQVELVLSAFRRP